MSQTSSERRRFPLPLRHKDWFLPEPVNAYTWDPESKEFFEELGVKVEIKESFYTSVHYLVKPRRDSPICCEIQVGTLFEEIWGDVDHSDHSELSTKVSRPRVPRTTVSFS